MQIYFQHNYLFMDKLVKFIYSYNYNPSDLVIDERLFVLSLI